MRSHASAKLAASDDTVPNRVNVYQVDEGKLLLHVEPESLVPPTKARCGDLGIEPTHDAFKKLDRDLSSLETQGLSVLRTLIYAVSKSKSTVSITRRDINTLQALDQHLARAFDGKSAEPLDVWLQNLRHLLDDKMVDVFTDDKIFQQDRLAFENDCRLGRLAIWRSSPDVDFISSMNTFGVYDSFPVDAFSRHVDGLAEAFSVRQDGRAVFARAKVFAIHPNIALAIIRPAANKGVNQSMYDTLLSRGSSIFSEFPRTAARRREGTRGRKSPEPTTGSSSLGVRIDGKMLEAREDDMLTYTPAQLSSRQTLLVNALVLHNASGAVIFRSTRDLHNSLNAYINDFMTWNDKKGYSRLQEQLMYAQMGKPIPERLASPRLPPPMRISIDDNAPMSDISLPGTPSALSGSSPPGTPASPTTGKKSRRQKKRDSMDRRSRLGLLSPPDSPIMSDDELPADSPFGSPLSATLTLVEGSPAMKSIDMVLSSPAERPKPLPRSLSLEPVVEIPEKAVQEASPVEEVVVYPRELLRDAAEMRARLEESGELVIKDAPLTHTSNEDADPEPVSVAPNNGHVSDHEPHAGRFVETLRASYDDPELEDYTDAAHEDEFIAAVVEPALDNVSSQRAISPLDDSFEITEGVAEIPATQHSEHPAEYRAPSPVDLDVLAAKLKNERRDTSKAEELHGGDKSVAAAGDLSQVAEVEEPLKESTAPAAVELHVDGGDKSVAAAGDLSQVAEVEEPVQEKTGPAAVGLHVDDGDKSVAAAGDLSQVAEVEERVQEKTAPAAVEQHIIDKGRPSHLIRQYTVMQWVAIWAAVIFVLLFASLS
ncbi:hypothetical protein BKA62DRAFT_768718 [Auriculariales sp. MPI-PUGE-AT-0066]|nr:hypothetical protein BKA62DRAFT_768718 [Auriculariales sp. MPI-PUGE-AT-0066]